MRDGENKADKTVVLRKWYFKIIDGNYVVLEGTRVDDESEKLWHSGPLVKRLSAHVLTTKSGTVYHLEGELNEESLVMAGISSRKISQRFKDGFPRNWSALIQKHVSGHQKCKVEDTASMIDDVRPMAAVTVKSEPGLHSMDSSMTGIDLLTSLKRSSRGRTLKPANSPLIDMSGFYSYDMYGTFEGIRLTPTIDLTLDDCYHGSIVNDSERTLDLERDSEVCLPNKEVRTLTRRQKDGGKKTVSRPKKESKGSSDRPVKVRRHRTVVPSSLKKKRRIAPVSEKGVPTHDDTPKGGPLSVGDAKKLDQQPSQEWSLSERLEEDDGCHGEWRKDDVKNLKEKVHGVPALTANFWEVVAQQFGNGHSARECSSKYAQITDKSNKKKKGARKNARASATANGIAPAAPLTITAKVGTLKRKRQIRDALEQMDQGYSDDIFDSTPFKKKIKKVQLQDMGDDELFHGEVSESEARPIQTPTEAKRRLGAPTSHTPKLSDFLTTPDLKGGMNRKAADNVTFRIQKTKKGKQVSKKKSPRPLSGKVKPLASEPVLRNIRTGEIATYRLFEDSDDGDSSSESNPFSDIDEAYQDIITQLH